LDNDTRTFKFEGKELERSKRNPYLIGVGQHAMEHWLGSHPDFKPCDVFNLSDPGTRIIMQQQESIVLPLFPASEFQWETAIATTIRRKYYAFCKSRVLVGQLSHPTNINGDS
jgi:hypothetical protein